MLELKHSFLESILVVSLSSEKQTSSGIKDIKLFFEAMLSEREWGRGQKRLGAS